MRRLLWSSTVCALVAACGQGGLTSAEYPGLYAQAYSAPISACRHEARYLAQQDLQDTRDLLATDLPRAIKLNRAAFDATQAQACLAALAGRGCSRVTEVPAVCWNAVRGLVADGGACSWLLECEHGFCSGDNGCPATCGGALTAGAACPGKKNEQCDARLGVDCVAGVCSGPLIVGAACDSTARCSPGLFCDSVDQKCAPQHYEQTVCGADEECKDGLYCQLTSGGGLCRRQVAAGQPCGEDADHALSATSQCADGLLCAGFSRKPLKAGTCAAPGDLGAGCSASSDVTGCASGLDCASGACAMPPGPGQPCFNGSCLRGTAFCDAGNHCVALFADGTACTDSSQCQSRDCDAASGKCLTPDSLHACHEP